jgi:hypothetical protein
MRLTRDLNNEEVNEIILDSDQQHVQGTLGPLAEWAQTATDYPDTFWERQQAEIRMRIVASQHSPLRPAAAWASAFAVVLLAIIFLNSGPTLPRPAAQNDSDQELLVAVEQSVQSGVPQALEPAAMLADEISNSVQANDTSHRVTKENQNENQ